MKNLFVIFMAIISIAFVSCNSKEKYDSKMKDLYISTQTCAVLAERECNTIAKIWNTAIFDNKDEDGFYCKDFNEALSKHFDRNEATRMVLNNLKDSMVIKLGDLKEYPSKCKEEYDDMVELVTNVSSFVRLAVSPDGSLSSYRSSISELDEDIAKKFDAYKIKHSEVLNSK